MSPKHDELEQRVDNLEREMKRIKSLYDQTLTYKDTDPRTFLMHARLAAEAICKNIFMSKVSPNPGNLMLDGLLEKLNAASVLPKRIALPLRTIQAYGNFGSHDQPEQEVITPEYIRPCLEAFVIVARWYFTEYSAAEWTPAASSNLEQRRSLESVGQPGITLDQEKESARRETPPFNIHQRPREDTPHELPAIAVTDVQGNTTTLSPYGVYYKPVGVAKLNDAFITGLIVERGLASETFAWSDIVRVEINGKVATLALESGRKVEHAELRRGTVVGQTQAGGEYALNLSETKAITRVGGAIVPPLQSASSSVGGAIVPPAPSASSPQVMGQMRLSDGRQLPFVSMGLLGWPAGIVPIQDLSAAKYSYSKSIREAVAHANKHTEELARVSLSGIKRIQFFIPTSEEQKELDAGGLGCQAERPQSHGCCVVRKVSLFFEKSTPMKEIFIILGSNKSPIAALGPQEQEYRLNRYDLLELSFGSA